MKRSAEISECGRYRYSLDRRWGDGDSVTFIMLNPSTADANKDDPTIRRCIGFAKGWGYDGLVVRNLFALRSTDKLALTKESNPTGGDDHVLEAKKAKLIIAAWGTFLPFNRERFVHWEFRSTPLYCLKKTKNGQPWHPLYVSASATPIPFNESAMTARRLE